MLLSYFLTALQNFRRQLVFSSIKVLSLSIGLACSVLVLMHVNYISNFDKGISQWENTYRLVTHLRDRETNAPFRVGMTSDPYAPQLKLDYPQIELIARIKGGRGLFTNGSEVTENDYFWAEPDTVELFELNFIHGNPETALKEPNSMILSETTAKKYFGSDNPLGRRLTLDDQATIEITGVIQDMPENGHLQGEIFISASTGQQIHGKDFLKGNGWVWFNGVMTYLRVPDPVTAVSINADLASFVERNVPDRNRTFAKDVGLGLELQAITDIYMNPLDGFGPDNETSINRTVLYALVVFSLLILIASCINYINLSLVQVRLRAKEIGVRKTLGARRSHIIEQFLIESMLLTFLALCIALPLVYWAIPSYTALTTTGFSFDSLFESGAIAGLILLVIFTGLIAGYFPALALSRYQPAHVVKGGASQSKLGRLSKAATTLIQFTLSSALILLAIAIYLQTDRLRTMDLGFNKDNLVLLDSRYNSKDPEAFNYSALRNDLLQHSGVVAVTSSFFRPPGTGSFNPWRLPSFDPNQSITVRHVVVDEHFIDTYQLRLLAGRGFSTDFPADFMKANFWDADQEKTYGIVITQATIRRFNLKSPEEALGQSFRRGKLKFKVIGVVENFQFSAGMETDRSSLGILRGSRDPMPQLSIRIDPAQRADVLAHIDAVWASHRPNVHIKRTFLDEELEDVVSERTDGISKAALFASVITIGISTLGLFALASFASLSRTKEVGIRKVLGASSRSIVFLLASSFLKPILLASIFSWPIAYYFISDFYSEFSSQFSFPLMMYVYVSAAIVVLAMITVSTQCLKAANSDPVKSLRYE